MRIRFDPTRPLAGLSTPPRASGKTGGPPGHGSTGDRFEREPQEEGETPFWLVRMATDRMAGRQYLTAGEQARLAGRERRFVAERSKAAATAVRAWRRALGGPPGLAEYQRLCDALAGVLGAPGVRLVWQPAMRGDRGQFLFRLEGSLIQLRPGAPGTLADWAGTVAHETYHHLQQESVVALYRGHPALAGPEAELAAYWRDAKSVYRARDGAMSESEHRKQALEVGAWAFGAAVARLVDG